MPTTIPICSLKSFDPTNNFTAKIIFLLLYFMAKADAADGRV